MKNDFISQFMKIFNSASRVVFLLVAATVCVGFALGVLSENNFMILAGGAFTYYFTRDKGNSSSPETQ